MTVATELIREINISGQARALRFLRFTDYLLIILGGYWLVGMWGIMLQELVTGHKVGISGLIFVTLVSMILLFGVYTGWRHVGVIDARVWRAHMFTFPLIIFLCIVVMGLNILTIFTLTIYNKEGGVNQSDFIRLIEIVLTLVNLAILSSGCILGFVSVCLLKRMRIKPLGIRLVELLGHLTSQGGPRAGDAKKIKRVNAPRGVFLAVFGGIILVGAILLQVPANLFRLLNSLPGGLLHSKHSGALVQNVVRTVQQLSLLAFFLLIRARRYFQVSADSLLAVDQRNPILFLRSFRDDKKVKFAESEKALLDFSLETRLSNHFMRFGPFIAIGSPKQALPVPGAARVLLSDSEWQPKVMGWMSGASLIIMYSGMTHWVNWELAKVIETDRVHHLILMIPEAKRWGYSVSYEFERIEHVKEVFRDTKWRAALEGIQDFPKLRAMLFHGDGSMTVITSRPRNRDSYHLAALVAHYIILNEVKQIEPKALAAGAAAGDGPPNCPSGAAGAAAG